MAINYQNKFYIRINSMVFDKENKYLSITLKVFDIDSKNFLFERKVEIFGGAQVVVNDNLIFEDNSFFEEKEVERPKRDQDGNYVYDSNGNFVMEKVKERIPISAQYVLYGGKYYKLNPETNKYLEDTGWQTEHFFDAMYYKLGTVYKFNIYRFLYEEIIGKLFPGTLI